MQGGSIRKKLEDLSERAKRVKANPALRHMPNEHDIRLASENTRLMQPLQYQTIEEEGGE